MSINRVLFQSTIDVNETINGDDLVAATISRNTFNSRKELTPTSDPPVSVHVAGSLSVTSSGLTINLASVAGDVFAAQNLTGLQVVLAKFKASADNVSNVTIGEGASNGYSLLGSGWSITLMPGQEITFYCADQAPTVASGDRTIDLDNVGTGTEENVVEFSITAG